MRAMRRFSRLLSRKVWARRLLALPYSERRQEPGVILIQVDGLARPQAETALREGRLPFLRQLLRKRGYRLTSFYSGVPSTTPAVQGELLYGESTAVPSFDFFDVAHGQYGTMLDPATAAAVEENLEAHHEGLLQGGSAYSDVYAGGSEEPHFCAAHLGWGELVRGIANWRLIVVALLHLTVVVRMVALAAVELSLTIADLFRGLLKGYSLRAEATMLLSRVLVGVVLREWITLGAQIDAVRGLPIIHVNYLGYDEQSHRRGPGSRYAHWTLKGIDRSIHRLWGVARRTAQRPYQLWIYSDHGHEHVVPFQREFGRTLTEAVAEVLAASEVNIYRVGDKELPAWQWTAWLRSVTKQKVLSAEEVRGNIDTPCVTHKGPVAQVYLFGAVPKEKLENIASALVTHGKVPAVILPTRPDHARAVCAWGTFELPDDWEHFLGRTHPFGEAVAHDLVRAVHHAWAGDLVLFGWRPDGPPVSFAWENGGHGGYGPSETHGFALLPGTAPANALEAPYLRPRDLRAAVMKTLNAPTKPTSDATEVSIHEVERTHV